MDLPTTKELASWMANRDERHCDNYYEICAKNTPEVKYVLKRLTVDVDELHEALSEFACNFFLAPTHCLLRRLYTPLIELNNPYITSILVAFAL